MKIHIISTPNENHGDLKIIFNLVSQIKGEIKFSLVGSFLNEQQYPRFAPKFHVASDKTKLEFEDFYEYCKEYRQYIDNKGEDIVVFITNVANRRGYFSAADGNNIFVYTGFWEEIVGVKKFHAIAYNILVNIFQSLLEISHFDNNELIHTKNIGCINDFCEEREQVILKLRTGYICDRCIEEANLKISNDELIQLYLLIQRIRENFMNFDKVTAILKPEVLIIDKDGNITIGNKILDLTIFQKTLYIFFLEHLHGFEFTEINNHLEEINRIFHTVRIHSLKSFAKRKDKDKIPNSNSIAYISIGNFQFHKTTLNERLIMQIGEYKATFYQIKTFQMENKNGSKSVFKVDLPSRNIKNNFANTQIQKEITV